MDSHEAHDPHASVPPGAPAGDLARDLFFPEIVKGMANTIKHFFQPQKFTIEYPEKKKDIPRDFRGEHALKRDAQGRVKCVACFLCATACPSECIHIVAGPTPAAWTDREKYPVKFDIDMLRCIYCGMCEEACPCDAIELTSKFYQVSETREEKYFQKDKLLQQPEKREYPDEA
ncbi:MAG: NADH-quinone oxidoreductase subunit I [Planctomycetes bacterium]|nr:NADH-quinone oxidoreductase subunit I [Planctomycetota bacterium]